MTNKESLREKLSQMISDTVWEVTDGGQKIDSKRFLTYQDEPVQSFEDIVDFFWNEIEQIRKSDMERVVSVLEKIKKIEPVTESDEMIQLASNIYADLLIMSLKQADEN